VLLNGIATACYVGSRLGPGPRDGLMTGLHARTGWSVRWVRTGIELTVLAVGWLLGGTVGIGTVLYAAAIGPLTQFFLRWMVYREPAGGSSRCRSSRPSRSARSAVRARRRTDATEVLIAAGVLSAAGGGRRGHPRAHPAGGWVWPGQGGYWPPWASCIPDPDHTPCTGCTGSARPPSERS